MGEIELTGSESQDDLLIGGEGEIRNRSKKVTLNQAFEQSRLDTFGAAN